MVVTYFTHWELENYFHHCWCYSSEHPHPQSDSLDLSIYSSIKPQHYFYVHTLDTVISNNSVKIEIFFQALCYVIPLSILFTLEYHSSNFLTSLQPPINDHTNFSLSTVQLSVFFLSYATYVLWSSTTIHVNSNLLECGTGICVCTWITICWPDQLQMHNDISERSTQYHVMLLPLPVNPLFRSIISYLLVTLSCNFVTSLRNMYSDEKNCIFFFNHLYQYTHTAVFNIIYLLKKILSFDLWTITSLKSHLLQQGLSQLLRLKSHHTLYYRILLYQLPKF